MDRIEAALTELEDSEQRYIEGLEQVAGRHAITIRATSARPIRAASHPAPPRAAPLPPPLHPRAARITPLRRRYRYHLQ